MRVTGGNKWWKKIGQKKAGKKRNKFKKVKIQSIVQEKKIKGRGANTRLGPQLYLNSRNDFSKPGVKKKKKKKSGASIRSAVEIPNSLLCCSRIKKKTSEGTYPMGWGKVSVKRGKN